VQGALPADASGRQAMKLFQLSAHWASLVQASLSDEVGLVRKRAAARTKKKPAPKPSLEPAALKHGVVSSSSSSSSSSSDSDTDVGGPLVAGDLERWLGLMIDEEIAEDGVELGVDGDVAEPDENDMTVEGVSIDIAATLAAGTAQASSLPGVGPASAEKPRRQRARGEGTYGEAPAPSSGSNASLWVAEVFTRAVAMRKVVEDMLKKCSAGVGDPIDDQEPHLAWFPNRVFSVVSNSGRQGTSLPPTQF
jgi:hypothetical protein